MSTSRYIAGWEIDFDDQEQLKKILLTQGIDKESVNIFSTIQTATELIINNDKISEVIKHSSGNIEVEKVNVDLPIKDWKDRKIFFLHKDTKGTHRIGGQKPEDFIVPKDKNCKATFIYFGTIDGSDEYFKWIGLERLHLCYPIYDGAFGIFFDYTDPNKPTLLNPADIDYSWTEENTKGVEKVQFKLATFKSTTQVRTDHLESNPDEYLLCGAPLWYQYPEIPICPKTGKVMQFVATINSDQTISLQNKKDIENLPFGDCLIFGDCGHLYIFYQPESKVLYLNVQF